MAHLDHQPRAVVVLVVGARQVPLGGIDPHARCDLGLVDDLLRLRLLAGRLGWSLRLEAVDADLGGLLDLVGVADVLGGA